MALDQEVMVQRLLGESAIARCYPSLEFLCQSIEEVLENVASRLEKHVSDGICNRNIGVVLIESIGNAPKIKTVGDGVGVRLQSIVEIVLVISVDLSDPIVVPIDLVDYLARMPVLGVLDALLDRDRFWVNRLRIRLRRVICETDADDGCQHTSEQRSSKMCALHYDFLLVTEHRIHRLTRRGEPNGEYLVGRTVHLQVPDSREEFANWLEQFHQRAGTARRRERKQVELLENGDAQEGLTSARTAGSCKGIGSWSGRVPRADAPTGGATRLARSITLTSVPQVGLSEWSLVREERMAARTNEP